MAMTKLLPPTFGPMSNVFGDDPSNDKLSSGISIGYPVLRIKGKVWSITRGGGEPVPLMRADGDGPRSSVDVVILAASQFVSKTWYESGFDENNPNPPDCYSNNGIVPDAQSGNKQNNTCADCAHNKWGSKITPAGKKTKACGDSKRVAIVPLGDIANTAFGGPMLLRVPAASLADFAEYGDMMEARGYRYFAIGTKIAFVVEEAYPKLTFEPIRPLTDEEGRLVLDHRKSEVVKAILQEGTDHIQEAVIQATVKLPPTFPQSGNGTAHTVTPKVTAPPSPPVTETKTKKTPVPPPPSPVDGFGGEPATTSTKPSRKTAAPPPPPASRPPVATEGAAEGDFESTLDAQLEELFPDN